MPSKPRLVWTPARGLAPSFAILMGSGSAGGRWWVMVSQISVRHLLLLSG